MKNIIIKNSIKTFCLAAGLLCCTSAFAQAGPWIMSEKNGDVSIGQSGVTKVAITGNSLNAGDTVKTGSSGRAVLTRGEQYMIVAPNSHIRIADPKEDGILTQIIEYFGSVKFNVDRRKSKHFEVKTPYMAAVVKGTTFTISVGAEGSTVQVTEGAVEVATLDGGATELLTPGNIGMVESGDPFSLNIFGDTNRVVESPNKVNALEGSDKNNEAVKSNKVAIASPTIARAINNAPVDLGKLTNGLITGEVGDDKVAISQNRNDGKNADKNNSDESGRDKDREGGDRNNRNGNNDNNDNRNGGPNQQGQDPIIDTPMPDIELPDAGLSDNDMSDNDMSDDNRDGDDSRDNDIGDGESDNDDFDDDFDDHDRGNGNGRSDNDNDDFDDDDRGNGNGRSDNDNDDFDDDDRGNGNGRSDNDNDDFDDDDRGNRNGRSDNDDRGNGNGRSDNDDRGNRNGGNRNNNND